MAPDKIKQITDVLDMLAEDTSIPRNIRKGATDAKARLMDTKEAMDVRATGAIVILLSVSHHSERRRQRRCSATISKKFWKISAPCSVFSTSGWN